MRWVDQPPEVGDIVRLKPHFGHQFRYGKGPVTNLDIGICVYRPRSISEYRYVIKFPTYSNWGGDETDLFTLVDY